MIQRQIDVALGERSYSMYLGADMVSSFAPMCRQHGISDSLVIIADRNVALDHLLLLFPRGNNRKISSVQTKSLPKC